MITASALWLLALASSPADAQFTIPTSCGPDTAPTQAAAAGFTCETYRWGSGDTLSEIDTTNSFAPGFKLYQGTAIANGYPMSYPTDYTFTGGQIVIKLASPDPAGHFSLNTCGPANGSTFTYTVGQYFTGGFYWEVAVSFDATSYDNSQGKPGSYGVSTDLENGIYPSAELDNVDGCCNWAFGVAYAYWPNGSGPSARPNTGTTHQYLDTIDTGHRRGALVTNSSVSWWYDDIANGTANLSGGDASLLFSSHECLGFMGTSQFPMTVISMKVWQSPSALAPNVGGGAIRRRR